MQQKQQTQKLYHDKKSKKRTFETGDTVSICNFPGDTWIQDVVEKPSGPLSYYIKLQDGRVVRRHIDHILARSPTEPVTEQETSLKNDDWTDLPDVAQESSVSSGRQVTPEIHHPLRRSSRPSIPPKRFGQDSTI